MNAILQILDETDESTTALLKAAGDFDLDAVARELAQRLVDRQPSGKTLRDVVSELARDIGEGRWPESGHIND